MVIGQWKYGQGVEIGRVPGLATYTRLKVDQKDRIKLSSLHRSGNEGWGSQIKDIYERRLTV